MRLELEFTAADYQISDYWHNKAENSSKLLLLLERKLKEETLKISFQRDAGEFLDKSIEESDGLP